MPVIQCNCDMRYHGANGTFNYEGKTYEAKLVGANRGDMIIWLNYVDTDDKTLDVRYKDVKSGSGQWKIKYKQIDPV